MLALTLCLSLLAPLQDLGISRLPDSRMRGREVVHAERIRLFLDAWEQADDEARQRARRTLERLRSPGASALAAPRTQTVTHAWRALGDPSLEEDPERERLQRFADALDLRASPGWCVAAREGKGQPITVRVSMVEQVQAPTSVALELWWERPGDPRGGARARREPFGQKAFEGDGFDMYVRSPLGAAGSWHLVPVVERGDQRVRGVPVVIEAVTPEVDAWRPVDWRAGEPEATRLLAGLEFLQRAGLRSSAGTPASSMIEALRGETMKGAPGVAFPTDPQGFEGLEPWPWSVHGQAAEARLLIVLLAPSSELPGAVLGGARGRAWRRVADELGAVLHSLRPPAPGSSPFDFAAYLDALLEHEVGGRVPVLVVARGDALPWLEVQSAGDEELPFDAAIVTSAVDGTPRSGLLAAPLLILAPAGPQAPARSQAGFDWVRGERLLLLDEPLLPELARGWAESVLELSSGGEGR